MEKRITTTAKTDTALLPKHETHGNSLQQLSVMCVYQDALTHEAAGRAGRAAINGTPVARRSWWNIEDFSEPGVLAGAAYMAMRADVIIVALSCKEGLPLPFYVWANSWLPYRKIAGGKLVVVLEDQEQDEWVMEHSREYLRQLAAHANMKFVEERPGTLPEKTSAPAFATRRNREHALEPANGARSVLVC
jgi:hypothetical protein